MEFLSKLFYTSPFLFLLAIVIPVLLFGVVMVLLQRAFPGAFSTGDGRANSVKFNQTNAPSWTVDTHGRPTPHSDNRSISGGY